MHPARVYYFYRFAFNLGFSIVFVTYSLFLKAQGFSLSKIVIVNACFLATAVLMELPTGMLADGRGRAWSLKMGLVFVSIAAGSYAFARSFPAILVCEFIYGIGCAFFSGAEDAWITDALATKGDQERLKHVLGTGLIFQQLGLIVGSGIGVFVSRWGEHVPWLCSSVFLIVPLVWCAYRMNDIGESEHRLSEFRALSSSFRALIGSRPLLWMIAVDVTLGLGFFFNLFWSISFEMRIGRVWLYAVWIVIQCCYLVSGWLVRLFTPPISVEASMISALVTAGIGLHILAASESFAVILASLIVNECARGAFQPYSKAYIQERIESGYRATYGSLQSGLTGAVWVGMYLIGAALIQGMTLTQASITLIWRVSAILLVVLSFVLWVMRPRVAS